MTSSPAPGAGTNPPHPARRPAPPWLAFLTAVLHGRLAKGLESSETTASEREPAEPRTRHEHAASQPGDPVGGVPTLTRPIHRPSARVLVVGPGDTLLLLQFRMRARTPESTYWLTPGGGIIPGESVAEAAARELREETGIEISAADLGPVVAYSTGEWSSGRTVFATHNSYFFVRTTETAFDASGQEELERSLIIGHHWWALDDLATTRERIVPANAAWLVRSLLADGHPAEPIQLPWG